MVYTEGRDFTDNIGPNTTVGCLTLRCEGFRRTQNGDGCLWTLLGVHRIVVCYIKTQYNNSFGPIKYLCNIGIVNFQAYSRTPIVKFFDHHAVKYQQWRDGAEQMK